MEHSGESMAALVQAFTTLVLGIVAAYIAWRQWRTSQDRLVLDLFERRFQVFQELTRTIATAFNSKPNVEFQDLTSFDTATEKARFLFGPEVHSYLAESRQRLIHIIATEHVLPNMPDGPQRTNAENKVLATINEMNEFYGRLATLVTPYMRVGQPPQPWRSLLDRVRGANESLTRRWRRDKR
jgi:hypothetical protein